MTNLYRLSTNDEYFLISLEPMQARFAQERTKTPSEDRFEKAYGSAHIKPKYEVKTFQELKRALEDIETGNTNHDLYETPNGIYRERMRVTQSLRDQNLPVNTHFLARAGYESLCQVMNANNRPQRARRQPGYNHLVRSRPNSQKRKIKTSRQTFEEFDFND
ncbi:hypothetical protein KA107_01575 [Candidatus Pacearchaeota archaeon]|nr:hypothetical protein [Candidatus Pacearchaeota archaeon]